MKERQKLSIDFDELFPGESLEIGNASVIIQPLGLEQISLITKRIESLGKILSEKGITWDNYSEKSNLFKIAVVILESFPDVLEEASNIDINDLKKLPIECIASIVNKVLEVNLKSRDDLLKNFKSLTEKLGADVKIDQTQTPTQTPNKKIRKK